MRVDVVVGVGIVGAAVAVVAMCVARCSWLFAMTSMAMTLIVSWLVSQLVH